MSNNIFITLGDDEIELKPSLKSATNISQRFNGFNGALQAVAQNDLAACIYVIRQAVSVKNMSTEALEEAVYGAGTRNLLPKIMQFVTRLANGGRDPEDVAGDDDND